MRLEYDLNVGALYIALTGQPVASTREAGNNANVDLDAAGDVVGIEVISAAHPWPLLDIVSNYKISSADRAQLLAYFRPAVQAMAGQRMQEALPVMEAEPTAPVMVAA